MSRYMSRREIAGGAPAARSCPLAGGRSPDVRRSGLLVVGVDPQNRVGWCAWKDGRLLESGVVEATDRQGGVRGVAVVACFGVFQRLRKAYSPDSPGVLVVENQHPFLPDDDRRDEDEDEEEDEDGREKEKAQHRARTMRGLEALLREVEARQTWEVFAEQFGWRIVRPHPMTWKCAVLGNIRGVRRPELKARSVALARELGCSPHDDNEADATCIGWWWVTGGNPPDRKPGLRGRRRKR